MPTYCRGKPARCHFLNVGQGEATLISCPGKRTHILIDSGESDRRYPQAKKLFLNALDRFLEANSEIASVIHTHSHSDHISGLKHLIGKKKIRQFIDNGDDNPNSNQEEQLRNQVRRAGIVYQSTKHKKLPSLDICQEVPQDMRPRLDFIHLAPEDYKRIGCPANLNDCSIVLRLQHGKISLLLLADVTQTWEARALMNLSVRSSLKSTILKIGHHGVESSSRAFLKAVDPEVAVLSTGAPDLGTTATYGYPRAKVIKRISEFFKSKQNDRSDLTSNNQQQLTSCIWDGSSCKWTNLPKSERLFSSAHAGTIEMHITQNSVCINGERTAQSFFLGT